ncbi:MFS transporter [Salinisphaera sp. SWV1]|uniref:MFS transporter n=2 Tax=unclassified Salinisphaera TaxID=2649847 RepID=UPI003F854D30
MACRQHQLARRLVVDATMHNNHPGTAAVSTLRVIAFGFVATFISSFGQTFFVGLFSEQFGSAANIGGTTVSLLYGIATLASGSLLFWLGGAMDRISLRLAAAASLILLIAGCLFAAGIETGAMLLAAFFLLRLGGQGLLTQLAVVAAARNGGGRRGATIAWATMGVILGEAILPATVIALLGLLYWRNLWLTVAALLLAVVTPALLILQRGIVWREPANRSAVPGGSQSAAPLQRRTLLSDRRFWAGAAIMLTPPFMATGFLFEQSTIAHAMNWNAGMIGAAFTVFAGFRAFGTWFYGRTADRFGTILMTRIHLSPMALAFASLALPLGPASIWVAFAGIGFTNGANSVLSGALWADMFGTAAVGTVRGVFGAAMVLASALAPVAVAAAMSAGLSAAGLGLVFGVYAFVVPILAGPFLYRRRSLAQPVAAGSD